jgi:voltage-gated potassium channel Kch
VTEKRSELKGIGYELFIGALSILSIVNLLMLYIVQEPALAEVLLVINAIMFPIFLGDFFYRLFTAENRAGYFVHGFGWADLLSSLPFQQVKIFRLFRIWRVIRLFMRFGVRDLVHEFIANRAANALLTVGFLVLCVLEFGSLSVLRAEIVSPDANITNAGDAIWWTFVTITTVGYGDRFPVTNWGRLIGVLVMVAGVGLFGTLSGFLANSFLSPPNPEKETSPDSAPGTPAARLAALTRMIEIQEKNTTELKTQLEELKKIL